VGGCAAGTVSSDVAAPAVIFVSAEFAETAASEFRASLSANKFLENAGIISKKIKVNKPAQRAVNRCMDKPPENIFWIWMTCKQSNPEIITSLILSPANDRGPGTQPLACRFLLHTAECRYYN
jgi:hypothetical protein